MMKKSGAALAVYALEQVGVRFTFGIPGVHNVELYDLLAESMQIEPILVTHELGAAFMADGVSRTSDSIGTLMVVPAAGTTHAMSGIGEAFLDGIPMLVITGGVRRDSGRSFQLHALDQTRLVQEITKMAVVVKDHGSLVATIYEAYTVATSGTPGPVLVEIPAEIQMFHGDCGPLVPYAEWLKNRGLNTQSSSGSRSHEAQSLQVQQIVERLKHARNPAIYAGWGAVHAQAELILLAERLGAPVALTMQGLSSFPANHPLHVGMGFGPSSVPAAENAFKNCDLLLTIGARFSELATGSFNLPVPKEHIHIDINPEVFQKNYPATLTLESESKRALQAILSQLGGWKTTRDVAELQFKIKQDKEKYFQTWRGEPQADRVSPGYFYPALRKELAPDAIVVVDDGNHTFLTAELFPVQTARGFIGPTDFNAMGYAVPAAIGAKIAHPNREVAAIVGDGGFLMTCNEIATASLLKLGVVFYVFHDGEMGQIAQFQKVPMNRKTCTVMGQVQLEGVALATGAAYLDLKSDVEIESVLREAQRIAKTGQSVIVDVRIDYSRKTRFTQGVVKANFGRFPVMEKLRFLKRAAKRHLLGCMVIAGLSVLPDFSVVAASPSQTPAQAPELVPMSPRAKVEAEDVVQSDVRVFPEVDQGKKSKDLDARLAEVRVYLRWAGLESKTRQWSSAQLHFLIRQAERFSPEALAEAYPGWNRESVIDFGELVRASQ